MLPSRMKMNARYRASKAACSLLFALIVLLDQAAAQTGPAAPSVSIPFRPGVIRTVSGRALVYELHVQDLAKKHVPAIDRVEVVDGDTLRVIANLSGNSLEGAFAKEGVIVNPSYLVPSGRTVIYMWLALDERNTPKRIRNRVYISGGSSSTYTDAEAAKVDPEILILGPPVSGDNWYVGQGPSNDATHRRFIFPFEGIRPRLSQRYAIDIGRVAGKSENFVETRGDPNDNTNWVAYGTPIIAVADARVSAIKDGIPENVPRSGKFAVPINQDTVAGNHVILDLGNGHYVEYGHLRPGSIKVKVGEKVRKGQALGEIGNSGRSSGPHLHFQVTDAPSHMDAEGLAYAFERFTVLGTCGETDCTPSAPREMLKMLPVSDQLIGFPEQKSR